VATRPEWKSACLSVRPRQPSRNTQCPTGFAGLFASVGFGAGVSTPFGTLLLDPTTVVSLADGHAQREFRVDFVVDVPNDPYLVGLTVAIQGIGATASGALLLGSAFQFTIQP
jgi:hypothetical protein